MSTSSKIVVVDIECTCWETARASEIIELGVCVLDYLTKEVSRKASFLVRPDLLDISNYCTKLTGITREQLVRDGYPLGEVLNRVRKLYPIRSSVWAGWGAGDRDHIAKETSDKGVVNPFRDNYLDIGFLYRFRIGSRRRIGLEEALRELGMRFEGRPHSGADDAWNAAMILRQFAGGRLT